MPHHRPQAWGKGSYTARTDCDSANDRLVPMRWDGFLTPQPRLGGAFLWMVSGVQRSVGPPGQFDYCYGSARAAYLV
jgi:hypothetical protein